MTSPGGAAAAHPSTGGASAGGGRGPREVPRRCGRRLRRCRGRSQGRRSASSLGTGAPAGPRRRPGRRGRARASCQRPSAQRAPTAQARASRHIANPAATKARSAGRRRCGRIGLKPTARASRGAGGDGEQASGTTALDRVTTLLGSPRPVGAGAVEPSGLRWRLVGHGDDEASGRGAPGARGGAACPGAGGRRPCRFRGGVRPPARTPAGARPPADRGSRSGRGGGGRGVRQGVAALAPRSGRGRGGLPAPGGGERGPLLRSPPRPPGSPGAERRDRAVVRRAPPRARLDARRTGHAPRRP